MGKPEQAQGNGVLRLLDIQALLGGAEELRRDGVGTCGLGLAQARGDKGRSSG